METRNEKPSPAPRWLNVLLDESAAYFHDHVYKPVATLPQKAYAAAFLGGWRNYDRVVRTSWRYFWWRELFHSSGGCVAASLAALAAQQSPALAGLVALPLGLFVGLMEGTQHAEGQGVFKTLVDVSAWIAPTVAVILALS